MSGSTPNFGWTYPTFGDTVSNSWHTLATQIDATLTTVDNLRTKLLRRPSVYLETNGAGTAASANTNTTLTINTSGAANGWQYPTTWHSNSTNPQNVVVPETGLYALSASVGTAGNTNWITTTVLVNGVAKFGQSDITTYNGGAAPVQGIQAQGFLLLTAADVITVQGRASAAVTLIPTFFAFKVSD